MFEIHSTKRSLEEHECNSFTGGGFQEGSAAYKVAFMISYGLSIGQSCFIWAYENFYPAVLK